jgi:hypothetical protein
MEGECGNSIALHSLHYLAQVARTGRGVAFPPLGITLYKILFIFYNISGLFLIPRGRISSKRVLLTLSS